ncbi:hypothetical protein G184_gp02 [Erwinia phage ENT90]|uniref:Uncharacterized protein n=1 Tax=Erwinia phage ENT90 TaxID=947843 RepID=F1BUT1_9CAUD|nr:hypothetical protein G184_gp02 [Erwinia phage ENT90]ADX32466.1 hypothetical protein [Erwinia phage ENT90]AIX75777.1 hypothetical protein PSNIH2_01125 [Pantoea sp. PSNIH2]
MRKHSNFINHTWSNNHACYGFMRLKRTAAINVLALVITFFRLARYVAAAFSVSRGLAKRTMHH